MLHCVYYTVEVVVFEMRNPARALQMPNLVQYVRIFSVLQFLASSKLVRRCEEERCLWQHCCDSGFWRIAFYSSDAHKSGRLTLVCIGQLLGRKSWWKLLLFDKAGFLMACTGMLIGMFGNFYWKQCSVIQIPVKRCCRCQDCSSAQRGLAATGYCIAKHRI